ncbi:transmembrane adaptor Erv26-domain-containing protein [Lasiosphaeria miniovina]|uniref:Transmembrane adaptor Erv26-domain-containing protein n=1 Tax=Lasiosphaeria miniovina TaxID=1954250 RepID=A0AA39ZTD6_9PEZI|nr:transmembrane adaptor Erv26-domain-containing protein [Lasiosphaeria miniovina]KAK0703287.1 transmembrane adaptor Erv26-domain-containing protein [Lasiosphaeria miniovina]
MWILLLVGYLGPVMGFYFLTVAIASGLYYLSELVEEHTVLAKRFLSRLIYSIMGLHLVLCVVDRFPFSLTLLSIVSHLVYLGNMRRFPYVKLSDPLGVLWLVLPQYFLVLLNHYDRAYQNMASYYDTPSNIPSFTQIASYFGICVWLVPFALFPLGSGPGVGGSRLGVASSSGGGRSRRGQGMAKALVDKVLGGIGRVGDAFGWKMSHTTKKPDERLA